MNILDKDKYLFADGKPHRAFSSHPLIRVEKTTYGWSGYSEETGDSFLISKKSAVPTTAEVIQAAEERGVLRNYRKYTS